MANTVTNVSAGKPQASGSIYIAPAGTTLPTDASTALASGFTCLGYVSDDGLKNEFSTEDEVKAWGGDVIMSTKEDKFTFTLVEVLSVDVLKAVYGSSNVTGSALSTGVAVAVNDAQQGASVWVFEMLLAKNQLKRIVVPKGTITEIGEITYKDDEPVGYEITITCGVDDDGNSHYEYIKTASST